MPERCCPKANSRSVEVTRKLQTVLRRKMALSEVAGVATQLPFATKFATFECKLNPDYTIAIVPYRCLKISLIIPK